MLDVSFSNNIFLQNILRNYKNYKQHIQNVVVGVQAPNFIPKLCSVVFESEIYIIKEMKCFQQTNLKSIKYDRKCNIPWSFFLLLDVFWGLSGDLLLLQRVDECCWSGAIRKTMFKFDIMPAMGVEAWPMLFVADFSKLKSWVLRYKKI